MQSPPATSQVIDLTIDLPHAAHEDPPPKKPSLSKQYQQIAAAAKLEAQQHSRGPAQSAMKDSPSLRKRLPLTPSKRSASEVGSEDERHSKRMKTHDGSTEPLVWGRQIGGEHSDVPSCPATTIHRPIDADERPIKKPSKYKQFAKIEAIAKEEALWCNTSAIPHPRTRSGKKQIK